MDKSAQRKVLIILVILLLSCLGGLIYWYFFNYKCGVLPNEFEFLEKFNTRNECRQKEYEMKGVIYNIREKEGGVIFDFNIWDKDTRESSYYENLELPRNSFKGNFELTEENWSAVEAKLILYGSGRKEIEIDELRMTEEEYSEVFNIVYEAITEGPLNTKEEIVFGTKPEGSVYVGVRKRESYSESELSLVPENLKYFAYVYDGFTNKSLYIPWILSYVYSYKDKLGGIIKIDKEDVLASLDSVYNTKIEIEKSNAESTPNPNCQPKTENYNPLIIDDTRYEKSNSFACLMLYQISENIGSVDIEVFDEYCSIGYFESSIQDYIQETEFSYNYSLPDFLEILDIEEFKKNGEDWRSPLHSSNTISILVDTYGARKLNEIDLEENLQERVLFVLNYLMNYDAFYIKNICSISQFSNLLIKDNSENLKTEMESINKEIDSIFFPVGEDILKLSEDDIYGTSLCLEEYEGLSKSEVQKLIKLLIYKAVELNLYDDKEIRGIWGDLEYDIRVNSRFLKLLILNKEILL